MTFYRSIVLALEWRLIAAAITALVLSVNGLSASAVGLITIETQIFLFVAQVIWNRLRV